jgi:hypothetical protein
MIIEENGAAARLPTKEEREQALADDEVRALRQLLRGLLRGRQDVRRNRDGQNKWN